MKAMMVFGDDCCCFVLQFVSRWCLAMSVVVSCCLNLFPSLHVVRFSFDFDTCADCFSGCVCAFLVARLAFVAICFALRVFHN